MPLWIQTSASPCSRARFSASLLTVALYLAFRHQMSELGIREVDGKGAVFAFFIFLSLCLYFVLYVH